MAEDFPKTLAEFRSQFYTEDACRRYLFHIRWPNGFICPVCQRQESWLTSRGTYCCASCGRHTSLTAGTIMHRSHIPLIKWLLAMWLICAASETGINARELQKELALGSYKSTWLMLQKFRQVMSIVTAAPLSGTVEVGVTHIGKGKGAPVCIILQLQGKRSGVVRLRHIADVSEVSLLEFIADCVKEGSTVLVNLTDFHPNLREAGYKHYNFPDLQNNQAEIESSPNLQQVATLLRKWILNTYQGRVDSKHLQRYLEEFTFRFNNYRRSQSSGGLFQQLISHVMTKQASSYQDITTNLSAITGVKYIS